VRCQLATGEREGRRRRAGPHSREGGRKDVAHAGKAWWARKDLARLKQEDFLFFFLIYLGFKFESMFK
jgi:hypothetical protein